MNEAQVKVFLKDQCQKEQIVGASEKYVDAEDILARRIAIVCWQLGISRTHVPLKILRQNRIVELKEYEYPPEDLERVKALISGVFKTEVITDA